MEIAIKDILDEMNLENSSNYKKEVVKKYINNITFQEVVSKALDKAKWTYGITLKNISINPKEIKYSIKDALRMIEKLDARIYTGYGARDYLEEILNHLNEKDRYVVERIIDRDLKVSFGRNLFNKFLSKEYKITKPAYCRCSIFDKESIKKGHITFDNGAIIQLKADGTYRECYVSNNISFVSRAGESYDYHILKKNLKKMTETTEGYLFGELIVSLDQKLWTELKPKLEKLDKKNGTQNVEIIETEFAKAVKNNKEYILPRAIGNGLINSDNPPHENIIYEVWDFVSPEDYILAGKKDKKNQPKEMYEIRFKRLLEELSKLDEDVQIRVIESKEVFNIEEAVEFASEKMKNGFEGAIIKDKKGLFKDGTANWQKKMKISFSIDVRITGFIEGTPGTKREKTFGSITYQTDDGLIKGSVSGFTDSELEDFNNRRVELMNQIIEIEGNDLTKGREHNYYAVSHPRFVELREDKDTTDTLERALLSLESAKNFK